MSTSDTIEIHVRLLDEGTHCSRPTSAHTLGDDLYRILSVPGYDPAEEKWEFPPNSIVRSATRTSDGAEYLLAVSCWYPFENGKTIGATGSENGVTLLDDEHAVGARITLERKTQSAPFAITCGLYGEFFHTRFFSKEIEARRDFEAMKLAIDHIISLLPMAGDLERSKREAAHLVIEEFVERFP